MIVKDTEFMLKDGRCAVLRCAREEDIESTLEYLRISAGETEFIVRSPEECGKYTYESEKAFFDGCNADPNMVMLLCVVDGRVAGNCEIRRNTALKTKHRAVVGISLISEFWNLGIGTKMFEEMIRAAQEEWEGARQIELGFVEGNTRARALYEKMGFRITGVCPNAFCMKDGRLLHEYLMIRELEK